MNLNLLDADGESLVRDAAISNFDLAVIRRQKKAFDGDAVKAGLTEGISQGIDVDAALNTAGRLKREMDSTHPGDAIEDANVVSSAMAAPVIDPTTGQPAPMAQSGQPGQGAPGMYGVTGQPMTGATHGGYEPPDGNDGEGAEDDDYTYLMKLAEKDLARRGITKPDHKMLMDAMNHRNEIYHKNVVAPILQHTPPNEVASVLAALYNSRAPRSKFGVNVANAPYEAAKRKDAETYQQSMQKYQQDSQDLANERRAADQGVQDARFMDQEEGDRWDKAMSEWRMTHKDIADEKLKRDQLKQKTDKEIQDDLDKGLEQAQKEVRQKYVDDGEWLDSSEEWLKRKAALLAVRHNLEPSEVYQLLSKYKVGEKTNIATTREGRLSESDRKQKQKALNDFIQAGMKSKDGWTSAMQKQAQAFIDSLPEEDKPDFLIPAPFETQQAFDQRRRAAETTRHNRANEAIGRTNATTGQGRLKESNRHNLETEKQGQQRINGQYRKKSDGTPYSDKEIQANVKEFGKQYVEALGKDSGARVEQFGPGSIPGSLHKNGKALDFYPPGGDFNKAFKYLQDRKVPYIIFNKKSYTLDTKEGSPTYGKYVVKDYTGPNDHTDHIHVDWKGGSPTQEQEAQWKASSDKEYDAILKGEKPLSPLPKAAPAKPKSDAKIIGKGTGKKVVGNYTLKGK